jgi:hypothetical protein
MCNESSSVCVQNKPLQIRFFHHIYCNTNHIHKKGHGNIIITSGHATKPKERAVCQLVGYNTNGLKVVTNVISHVNIAIWLHTKHRKEKLYNMFVATHKASIFKIMGA